MTSSGALREGQGGNVSHAKATMFRIISRHAPAKNIEQEMIAVQSVPEKRLTGSNTLADMGT